MSQMKLAVFGHYKWSDFYGIPLVIFRKEGLFSKLYVKDVVAQWVYPHLTALAYMRHFSVVYEIGADISELWVSPPKEIRIKETLKSSILHWEVKNLVNEMLKLR